VVDLCETRVGGKGGDDREYCDANH